MDFKSKESIWFTEFIKQICIENKYTESYLLGSVDSIDESKLSIGKNKKVRDVSEILREDKNIAVVNKNPIKLQYAYDNKQEIKNIGVKWVKWVK